MSKKDNEKHGGQTKEERVYADPTVLNSDTQFGGGGSSDDSKK